jgi:hypothetical protein
MLEITHYSQCSGENMHLAQGVVMWLPVLLFCPEHMLLLPTPKGSLEDSACIIISLNIRGVFKKYRTFGWQKYIY